MKSQMKKPMKLDMKKSGMLESKEATMARKMALTKGDQALKSKVSVVRKQAQSSMKNAARGK